MWCEGPGLCNSLQHVCTTWPEIRDMHWVRTKLCETICFCLVFIADQARLEWKLTLILHDIDVYNLTLAINYRENKNKVQTKPNSRSNISHTLLTLWNNSNHKGYCDMGLSPHHLSVSCVLFHLYFQCSQQALVSICTVCTVCGPGCLLFMSSHKTKLI